MRAETWDIFTALLVVSFLANAVLAIVIWSVDPKKRLNRLYGFLCLSITYWAAMKLGTAFSTDASMATFHYKASGPSWCLLPSVFLHFVSVFTGRSGPRRRALITAFYALSAGFVIALWADWGMLQEMRPCSWGYTDVPGPIFAWGYQPFLLFGFVLVIRDLVLFGRAATSREERQRANLVLVGLSVPLAGALATDLVLPSFGVFPFEVSVPLTTLNAGLIAFAMVRYQLMSITVEYAASAIIETMGDSLLVLGLDGRVRLVNPAALELLGYGADELVGLPVERVWQGLRFDPAFCERVARRGRIKTEARYVTASGAEVAVSLSVAALKDRRGRPAGYVCVAKDIRALRLLIEEIESARADLEELAVTDDLTGLHNRRYLMLKLREERLRSQRFRHPFSIVIVDLDRFKEVNDRFGHEAGDRVLRRVARAIRPLVRNIDTAARYGGDEFVVLLPETNEDEAVRVAQRIRNALGGDDALPPEQRFVTASLGVSTYDPRLPEPDENALFRLADWALLQAKRTGRNRVVHARDAEPLEEDDIATISALWAGDGQHDKAGP